MTPFGIKLKYIRVQRHKSLKDLSRALKVSIAYVSMLENGKRGRIQVRVKELFDQD